MEINEAGRDQILEVLKEEMRSNKPPEVKRTCDRLRKEGYVDLVTLQMLRQCLAVEFFKIFKFGKTFSNERYVKN